MRASRSCIPVHVHVDLGSCSHYPCEGAPSPWSGRKLQKVKRYVTRRVTYMGIQGKLRSMTVYLFARLANKSLSELTHFNLNISSEIAHLYMLNLTEKVWKTNIQKRIHPECILHYCSTWCQQPGLCHHSCIQPVGKKVGHKLLWCTVVQWCQKYYYLWCQITLYFPKKGDLPLVMSMSSPRSSTHRTARPVLWIDFECTVIT